MMLRFFVLVGSLAAFVEAVAPGAASSLAIGSTLKPNSKGTVAVTATLAELLIAFQPADDNGKQIQVLTVDKDNVTLSETPGDYKLLTKTGACPTDFALTGFTEVTDSSTLGVEGALGTLTFSATASTGVINVKWAQDKYLSKANCFIITAAKATLKNCTSATPVKLKLGGVFNGDGEAGTEKVSTWSNHGSCKKCTDAKADAVTTAAEITKNTYCYCGENTSTETKRLICGDAEKSKKCVRTGGGETKTTYDAKDTYECKDFSGDSDSHSSTTVLSLALTLFMFGARRLM